MIEIARIRDVAVLVKADCFTVHAAPSLTQWKGGLGVQWSLGGDKDIMEVEASKGLFGGFLLRGSDESADQFISLTGYQVTYGMVCVCVGNWVCWFQHVERYTYASRTNPGPLVPIVYQPNDLLYFSLRGLWTNEDEIALSGGSPNPLTSGYVVCPPTSLDAPMMIESTI